MKLKSPQKPIFALIICLVISLISMVGSNLMLTSGGRVEMHNLILDLPTGETIRVIEYRPAGTSVKNPAPAIVFSHGNDNTAEVYQNYALELSRRGFAVFAPDLTSAGLSSQVQSSSTIAFGVYDLINYIYNNLDYIDKTRIGLTGYSKGGVNVMDVMNAYGKEQRENPKTYVKRISSAFIMAPKWDSTKNFATDINVGVDVGLQDPYSRISFKNVKGYFPGDLTVKAEIKDFINQAVPSTFSGVQISDSNTKVILGKVYGNYASGNGRVVYNAKDSTHGLGSISPSFIKECTQYFMDTLGAPNPIPAGEQIWFWNFLLSAMGLLSILIMIVPLTLMLAQWPIFRPIIQPVQEPCAELRNTKDKILFVVVSLCIAFVSPIIAPKMFSLPGKLFTLSGHPAFSSWFLLGGMANNMLCWTVVFTLINLVVFFAFYFLIHRRNGLKLSDFGINITWVNVGRTMLLGLSVFVICYLIACFADYVFNVGFQMVDMSLKKVPLYKFGLIMRYIPFYIIFWCINSLIMNGCNRFKGMNEIQNILMCIGCNIVGIFVVAAIYYIKLYSTGVGIGPFSDWKAYMSMLYMIITMTIGTIVNRKIYLKTGSIYLGPVVYAILLTVITHGNYMIPDFLY